MSRLERAGRPAPVERDYLLAHALDIPAPSHAEASVARLEMQGAHVEFWSLTPWGAVTVRRVSTAALVKYVRGEHSDA